MLVEEGFIFISSFYKLVDSTHWKYESNHVKSDYFPKVGVKTKNLFETTTYK